jgi:16S rRNA processing protein RimM
MSRSTSSSSTDPTGPDEPRLLEIGRVGKAHGLAGDVLVRLTTNVDDRLVPGLEVTLETEGGRTLTVESARPHQDRWIVRFAGVSGRDAADELRGTVLLAVPVEGDDPDALWVHELIGAEVVDVAGTGHGTVVAVLDNPASDLLELASGRLVPLTFVVAHEGGRVVVDVPPGLLDDDG